MSTPVTVAVLTDGALRAYYRNGSGHAEQVAQLVVAHDIEPSVIASIVADLGDAFGWGANGAAPRAAGRAAGALPVARPVEAKAQPRRRSGQRSTPDQTAAERAAILDAISAQPGITRAELGDRLGYDTHRVKNRTERMLEAGLIDARPLPGRRERGPGGGHGLFPLRPAPVNASDMP